MPDQDFFIILFFYFTEQIMVWVWNGFGPWEFVFSNVEVNDWSYILSLLNPFIFYKLFHFIFETYDPGFLTWLGFPTPTVNTDYNVMHRLLLNNKINTLATNIESDASVFDNTGAILMFFLCSIYLLIRFVD